MGLLYNSCLMLLPLYNDHWILFDDKLEILYYFKKNLNLTFAV